MNYIWEVEIAGIGLATEMQLFEDNHMDWLSNKKRLFSERSDAENYVRPIAVKAFEYMLSDWEANTKGDRDEEEYFAEKIKLYRARGLQQLRTANLDEDDLYYDSNPKTIFVVRADHEYDRDGEFFASVSRVILN